MRIFFVSVDLLTCLINIVQFASMLLSPWETTLITWAERVSRLGCLSSIFRLICWQEVRGWGGLGAVRSNRGVGETAGIGDGEAEMPSGQSRNEMTTNA